MAMFPCSDCDLLAGGSCRITNQVREALDECTLTVVQQRDLLMQSKRLLAARGSAREVVINSVTRASGPGCRHIRIVGTVDGGALKSWDLTKREVVDLLQSMNDFERVLVLMAELLLASGADTPAEVVAALEEGVFYIGS